MKKQLEIDYAFGYVYDKSKLIVMYPAGTNIMDLDEYEMEVEVAFLEDGIEAAFEENDIKEANETIKPLETFLMKPSKVIPFVVGIKDAETKEELPKLLKELAIVILKSGKLVVNNKLASSSKFIAFCVSPKLFKQAALLCSVDI